MQERFNESDTCFQMFLEMLKPLKDVSFKDFSKEVFIKGKLRFLKISMPKIWLVAIGFTLGVVSI